jgi:MFS family permease
MNYKVDTEYEYYINNWVVEMDLVCTPKPVISMMMTFFFIGVILNSLYAHIPDRIGRRKSVIYGTGVSLVGQTIMVFCSNFTLRTLGFFILGLSQIKASQSYVWCSECVPLSSRSRVFTIINIFDASPMVVTCTWFMFVESDWYLLNLIMLSISYVAFALAFLCPESPRWLLVNGMKEQAIEAFNSIAASNGSQSRIPEDTIFNEEAQVEMTKKKSGRK